MTAFGKLRLNGLGGAQGSTTATHLHPFGLSLSKPGHAAIAALYLRRLNNRNFPHF